MIVDDISTCRPDVLKKPKKDFVDNELIERSDVEAEVVHADTEEDAGSDGFIPSCELELDQDVISKNVSKALDSLGSDDLDVEKLMDYDEDVREKSKETYSDESSDVEKSVMKGEGVTKNLIKLSEDMNVTKVGLGAKRITNLKACGCGIPNEEYLKQFKPSSYFDFSKSIMSGSSSESENVANGSDSTSPAYETADERSQTNEQTADDWHWRTEEIDNRGFGQHKELLENMAVSGSEKDKNLLDVLSVFTKQKTVSSTDAYSEHEDEDSDEVGGRNDRSSEVESGAMSDEVGGSNDRSSDSVQPGTEDSDVYVGENSDTDHYGSENPCKEGDETISYGNESTDVVKDGVCKEVTKGDETSSLADVVKDDGRGKERDETERNGTERDETTGYGDRSTDVVKDDGELWKECDEDSGLIPGVINIMPDKCEKGELPNIINLTGQYLHDVVTGQVYNIDNIDISQFTQIYLVDAVSTTVPTEMTKIKETNYTVSVIVESGDESEGKIKKEEEDKIPDESSTKSMKRDEEKDSDEKDKIPEESPKKSAKHDEEKDVDLISVKNGLERCDNNSTDSSVQVLSDQSKSDTSYNLSERSSTSLKSDTTWQPDSGSDGIGDDGTSVRLSPDKSRVCTSKNKITVVDKPPRLRSETRGQYMCRSSRQFLHMNYKKPPPPHSSRDDSILYAFFLNQLSPILGFHRCL